VAQCPNNAFDGVIGTGKAVGIDQILVDDHAVAGLEIFGHDELTVNFAQAGGN
jgi:hypothetical protein